MADFDSRQRDIYWNNYYLNKDKDDLIYHLSGADKDISKTGNDIANKLLLHYFYRFLLEEKILGYLIKKYCVGWDLALDGGCGTGRNSLTLSRYFNQVDAFDISPNFIGENKERFHCFENINFFLARLPQLKTIGKKYDFIFIGSAFMYMDEQEISEALEIVGNLIEKGGILITRDTISKDDTIQEAVKIYRSRKDYEKLFSNTRWLAVKTLNGANRNLWSSIFGRLPKKAQASKKVFNLFKLLIKLTIFADLLFLILAGQKRFSRSNQLFYIFKPI